MSHIEHFEEPELQFSGGKHIDIRYGLMNYGPLDYMSDLALKNIRIGIIGTTQSIQDITNWFAYCSCGIQQKDSTHGNLFPRFPGFGENSESQLSADIITNSDIQRQLLSKDINKLLKHTEYNDFCIESVSLFVNEIEQLSEKKKCDVAIVALPSELFMHMQKLNPYKSAKKNDISKLSKKTRIDFHNLLKAKSMRLGIPTQIITPNTVYLDNNASAGKTSLQDAATRAWNLYTALYYKAGGIPWRLVRNSEELTSCFIGVCFYNSFDKESVQTSMAQVFNERGEGIVVRGEKAIISKEDRQPHLDKQGAYDLLSRAFKKYRSEHRNLPARVFVHKTSKHSSEELDGFYQALEEKNVDVGDFSGYLLTAHHIYLEQGNILPYVVPLLACQKIELYCIVREV